MVKGVENIASSRTTRRYAVFMKVTFVYPNLLKHLGWDPERGSSSNQKAHWSS